MDNLVPYIGVVGLILVIVHMVRGIAAGQASANWPTVTGRITGSRVEKEESWERVRRSDGRERRRRKISWIPQITYEYEVGGRPYTGKNVAIFRIRHKSQKTAQQLVGRYPVGREIPVYYDPEQPDKAVLQTGVPGRSKSVLALFVILLAALVYSIVFSGPSS